MNKKKLILITGTQNRHLSVAHEIIKRFEVIWIQYKRKLVPQREEIISNYLKNHLDKLVSDEEKFIGKFDPNQIEKNKNVHEIIKVEGNLQFNDICCKYFEKNKEKFDASLIYGSGIIKNKLLKKLPFNNINIHGGISPYFKGSSTLLYALALCQPELLGMTIHRIDEGIDSGDLFCHIFPNLVKGMRPTEMFAACQRALMENISHIIKNILDGKLLSSPQSKFGRTFMERDYRENLLKSVYFLSENKMYDNQIEIIQNLRSKYKLKPWMN